MPINYQQTDMPMDDKEYKKFSNELLSISPVYNRERKKLSLVIHPDNDIVPDVVHTWDELFDVLKENASLKSMLGEYDANS